MVDYLKELFDDKKTYIIFIAIFLVAIIVISIYIWWPKNKEQKINEYSSVDLNSKYKEIGYGYLNTLSFYIRYSDKKSFYSNISEEYLTSVGKSKEELYAEVFSSEFKEISGLEVSTYNGKVVYSTTILYTNNKTRQMNIVEEKPYEYVITFDNFIDSYELFNKNSAYGIEVSVNRVFETFDTRKYDISIYNGEYDSITIDLSKNDNIYLELYSGDKYNLVTSMVSNDFKDIKKGATINSSFEFSIPFSLEGNIRRIVIKNVEINGAFIDINLSVW